MNNQGVPRLLMKYALIGSGFIMPRHAEAIFATGGKITDVVNTNYGEENWREVVAKTDADCVVILTPNNLHFPIAIAALARGKTVLSEKPLSFKSAEIRELMKHKNVFSVLQLKYHPLINEIKKKIGGRTHNSVEMDISVYRDPEYYKGWKGTPARSGGILFNLGIHYFDLLTHLFGNPLQIEKVQYSDRTASGTFKGADWDCTWRVSTDERRDNQRRVFKINSVDYNFSSKDNLSYENLHRRVYEDLLRGKGVTPVEALPATELIEGIYKAAGITLA